jgi:hypothetical protein
MRASLIAALGLLLATAGSAIAAPTIAVVPPSPIDCGNPPLNVGNTTNLVVTNTGDAPLDVTAVGAPAGPQAAAFALSGLPGLPLVLAPNTSFNFNVTFTPAMVGASIASITIISNDPNRPNLTLQLTGTSGPPVITVDAGTLMFGNEREGFTTAPQTVNITNTGFGDLHVTSLVVGGANPGDFVLTPMNAVGTLKPGRSTPFSVSFAPTQHGNLSAFVTISSDDPNQPGKNIVLGGTGTQAILTVAPNMLDFGNMMAPLPVTITNAGDAGANLNDVTFTGPQANSFAVSGIHSGPIPPNGGTLVIQIVAVPLQIGINSATLNLLFDDPMTPLASLPLSANPATGMVQIAPMDIDFGIVPVFYASTPQTVTITNQGAGALTLIDVELSGADLADFQIVGPPMTPFTIPPLAKISFGVVFTPSRINGQEIGSVDLDTDDPNAKFVKIPLTGTGTNVSGSVMPASLDFGALPVGASIGPLTVTYTNGYDIAVVLQSISTSGADATSFSNTPAGPLTVDPGKSLEIAVSFAPKKLGMLNAALLLQPANLPPYALPLRGVGLPTVFEVTPAILDFGDVLVGGTSMPSAFTIHNDANLPLSLETIGSSDGQFIVDRTKTATTIPPGGTTTVAVSFHPSLVGEDQATINVKAMGSDAMVSVTAKGTGVPMDVQPMLAPGCSCSLSPRAPSGWPLALLLLGLAATSSTRCARGRRSQSSGRRCSHQACRAPSSSTD